MECSKRAKNETKEDERRDEQWEQIMKLKQEINEELYIYIYIYIYIYMQNKTGMRENVQANPWKKQLWIYLVFGSVLILKCVNIDFGLLK